MHESVGVGFDFVHRQAVGRQSVTHPARVECGGANRKLEVIVLRRT
jgi:hypothetical protein